MSNITKHALEESLKRLLLKKPLTKITINDLTTDCGDVYKRQIYCLSLSADNAYRKLYPNIKRYNYSHYRSIAQQV